MNIMVPGTLLTGLMILVACRDDPQTANAEPPRRPVTKPRAQPAPAKPAVARAKRVCSITDADAANDPFGTELTAADIVRSGGRITSRKAVKNAHTPKQTDTLVTVQQGGNRWVFYRTPEKDLLSSATLVTFTTPYGQALRSRVGASYRRQGSGCDSLLISDDMQMNRVVASMSSGQVRKVRIEPYLD
ncbi:hypothetical protein D3Y59_13095 [Hymenobacter oligotrophus]|uniref:Uncharacterized protein n=2 Tax=Hymenobacter oligotrophus TaxID=2319843 RepID=A0A3B7RUA7_9BACT|nr:hypothetical protein D3Y59_13095 [Hymenobacter oligotrophus]